jgi:hypothetical protein
VTENFWRPICDLLDEHIAREAHRNGGYLGVAPPCLDEWAMTRTPFELRMRYELSAKEAADIAEINPSARAATIRLLKRWKKPEPKTQETP